MPILWNIYIVSSRLVFRISIIEENQGRIIRLLVIAMEWSKFYARNLEKLSFQFQFQIIPTKYPRTLGRSHFVYESQIPSILGSTSCSSKRLCSIRKAACCRDAHYLDSHWFTPTPCMRNSVGISWQIQNPSSSADLTQMSSYTFQVYLPETSLYSFASILYCAIIKKYQSHQSPFRMTQQCQILP